ncbi:hypothetical protein IMY05_014G0042200 [Salix suchowensis]|nr:hypothetical protein IMY05_014G0042200 [Salix suchowensis]
MEEEDGRNPDVVRDLIDLGDPTDESPGEVGISLHAIIGNPNPRTMRVKIKMKGHQFIALIDTGSTHNFVHPRVVRRTGLRVTKHLPVGEPSLTPETPTDAEQDETGFSLQALDSNISDQMAPERHKPAKEEVKCKRGGTDEKKDEIPGRLGLNDKAGQMASPASFTIKEEKGQPRGSSDEAKDKQCGRPGFKDPDHAIYH